MPAAASAGLLLPTSWGREGMDNPHDLADKVDQQIVTSRLNSIASIIMMDRSQRVAVIERTLSLLPPGAYLLGTGPSTSGIYPLTVEEVTLGRSATPAEEPADATVDFLVSDAVYFLPQEVSRVHAKIIRRNTDAGNRYVLFDLNSTCGTFVNGEIAGGSANGRVLTSGDMISLGSSNVSTYVFFEKPMQADE